MFLQLIVWYDLGEVLKWKDVSVDFLVREFAKRGA